VSAGVIAWVLLGESLNRIQIVGAIVVLVGIVLAETARQAVPPQPDALEAGRRQPEGASPLPEGMAP
jgi:hypothetical protein